jgi:hypothetical protein
MYTGIPDFRSPGGFYDTLKKQGMDAPEDTMHINMFREKPGLFNSEGGSFIIGIGLCNSFVSHSNGVRRSRSVRCGVKGIPFMPVGRSSGPVHPHSNPLLSPAAARKWIAHRLFTRNIDTMERLVGIPREKVVEAHGTFADARCIACGGQHRLPWCRSHLSVASTCASMVHCSQDHNQRGCCTGRVFLTGIHTRGCHWFPR